MATAKAMVRVNVSPKTRAKLQRFGEALKRLPESERDAWRNQLQQQLLKAAQAASAAGLVVVGAEGETEWDLQLANWLDGSYTIVAERVEAVGKKVADGVSIAGMSLWPLAAVGVVAYLLMKRGK